MEHQLYQPLSAALHAPVQSSHTSHTSQPQHYSSYASHATSSTTATNGVPQHSQQREEEEEEEDDEDVVEDELEHRDQQSPSVASPRVAAVHPSKSAGTSHSTTATQYSTHAQSSTRDEDQNALDDSKRKPGRPRGSRNRKSKASTSTSSKAPAGSQHPGFYQYPPAPPGGTVQNQHFYDFQWRALNLCSEFYNAAEELIKNAHPVVIAQCYQSGPATRIDPLALVAEAKRVCDNLLANPSQLAGQPPPAVPAYNPYPSIPPYGTMAPPPAPAATSSAATATTATSVINNPQSFVMPLSAPPMPPAPGYPPQPYYPAYPPAASSRYPTAPYYYGAPQSTYYPPPPPTQGTPAPSAPPANTRASVPPPPTGAAVATTPTTNVPAPQETTTPTSAAPVTTSNANPPITTSASAASTSSNHPPPSPASGLSAFNATTGDVAPGGTQGAWSETEIDKLKGLAERSKTAGGPQNRGEIEWDWVVQQWGNTRTRHQILLKATSLGLKESTTRGTKRRRDPESSVDMNARQVPPPSTHGTSAAAYAPPPATVNVQVPSPAQSSTTSNPPSAQASPATQPMRPPSSSLSGSLNPTRPTAATSSSGYAWPMPTIATSNSPILTSSQVHTQSQSQAPSQADSSPSAYYRRPTQPTYGHTVQSPATQSSALRPPSAHGVQPQTPNHLYMYRPLQNGSAMPRRENGM